MSQRTGTINTQNVQIHVNGANTAKSWPTLFSAARSPTTSLHDRAGHLRMACTAIRADATSDPRRRVTHPSSELSDA